jgi:hypothetical protein
VGGQAVAQVHAAATHHGRPGAFRARRRVRRLLVTNSPPAAKSSSGIVAGWQVSSLTCSFPSADGPAVWRQRCSPLRALGRPR